MALILNIDNSFLLFSAILQFSIIPHLPGEGC